MTDILGIGIRGLQAFREAIAVAGQNIANVKTPYYSRREANFVADMFNNGVSIGDITRVYSDAASKFLQTGNSQFEMSSIFYQQASELETLLGNNPKEENKTTIGVFLNAAVTALRQLNADTGSIQARNMYLDRLSALSNRFNTISNQISQRQENINQSLDATVETVNKIAKQLATLNVQISAAHVQGQDTAALLDLREAQIQELSKYMDFSTQTDSSGNVNVLFKNGTPLVFGSDSGTLSTAVNPVNPDTLILQFTSGVNTTDVTNVIQSGQIAGLYQTQASLQSAQTSLGQLSLGIMSTFNAQNKLGIDLNGNLGGNIFPDINNPTAMGTRVLPNLNNAGSASLNVSINDISLLQTSDYKLIFDSPTHYTLTRLSDKTVMGSGTIGALPQQITADGFSININSGPLAAGDQFVISPTRSAAADMAPAMTDSRLLALGWPVNSSASSSNLGTGAAKLTSILDTTNAAFSLPQQLNPPITIKFLTATTYQLVNATTSAVIEGPLTYDPVNGSEVFPTAGSYDPGYRISLSGPIQAGDSFNVTYNLNASGDNRNGLVMEQLYNKGILNGGSRSFSSAYSAFAGDIANQVNAAGVNYLSNQAVKDMASSQYAQISGVEVPEEANNLAMYQQCYQACAQVIDAAQKVFDTIIGLGRG